MRWEEANHHVATVCRVLGVSTSGYYAWLGRPASKGNLADEVLTEVIGEIHRESRSTYGVPRVHAEFRLGRGIRVGRKRVAHLMRQAGLQGAHRRRRFATTRRNRTAAPAPDLVERAFARTRPDELWVADIKDVPTWSGTLYLAAVVDTCTRLVVGWSMRETLHAELVCDALEMALWRRGTVSGVIHHSDQGCQYTSFAFGRRLREAGIAASMDSVGDTYDNALAESFFATLETELLMTRSFRNRSEARLAVFEYIEGFYNPHRRHSSIDYLSPLEYERRCLEQRGVA